MTKQIKALSIALVLALLTSLLSVGVSLAASDERFEQTTPFGIAHREDGADIGIYAKVGNKKASASLTDYTLCSIISTQTVSGSTWFQVSYFDTSMKEQKGYVKGEEFYQLTVAGLISLAADPDTASYLQRFSGVSDSSPFISTAPAVSSRSSTVTESSTSTSSEKKVTYVLNKNTKKFHYPWCDSVDDIKPKNRQDFYGDRSEIPSKYVPCKKCNP